MNSDRIIGHEKVKLQIYNSIKAGTLSHAHLIVGEDGIGKSLLAKDFALKILNKEEEKQYPDIIEWRVAQNRHSLGVNDVRDIIEEVNKKPYEGDKKVIILYSAEKMTVQAQNAFLKTIEEPPKGVFIVLLCENQEAILETIRSRCQIHMLSRLGSYEMESFLKRKYPELGSEEVKCINAFSDGIPGRAEKFMEDDYYKEMRDKVLSLFMEISQKNIIQILPYEDFLLKHKDIWQEVLTCFLSYIRDVMVYKETGDEELTINIDKISSIKELASIFSFSKLSAIIEIINYTRENLERNVNAALVFDAMLIKINDL